MIIENIKNIRKINNINLLKNIDNDKESPEKQNIYEKAKRLRSGIEIGDGFILFRNRNNKAKRLNENHERVKQKRRTLSCVGVQKIQNEHPNAAAFKSKHNEGHRASLTPSNLRSLSVCSKDDVHKINRLNLKKRCESTLNKSQKLKSMMLKQDSPIRPKLNVIVRDSLDKKLYHDAHIMTKERDEALKTVERKIIEKYASSPVEHFHNIRRFKQLQEYLKMSNREVIINHNVRNEEHRIVKGEIPLGTDTKIKHEVRENFPKIKEIKNRLKKCLSIKCDYDEVIKYAKEHFGVDNKSKQLLLAFAIGDKQRAVFKETIDSPIEIKPINEEKENEDKQDIEHNTVSFTKKKWSNIDELIQVLKEELEVNKNS